MLGCVNQAGFDASIDGESLDSGSMPPAQFPVYSAVLEACQHDNGLFPVVEPSELDWNAFYTNVNVAASCLRNEGYDIPDAPSRHVFEQNYATDPYSPFLFLPNLSSSDFSALEQECPQPTF